LRKKAVVFNIAANIYVLIENYICVCVCVCVFACVKDPKLL